jgi:osmotically-inducible protein OsmY
VHVRVRRGVATLSGEVADRATAERLREHVRQADGVGAVAGRVALAASGESFVMDDAPE